LDYRHFVGYPYVGYSEIAIDGTSAMHQHEDKVFALPTGEIIINKAQLLYFYTVNLEWVENDKRRPAGKIE
jgi:hypothetical protein